MWIIKDQEGIEEINKSLVVAIELVATKASYSRNKAIRPTLKQVRQTLAEISDLMAVTIVWEQGGGSSTGR